MMACCKKPEPLLAYLQTVPTYHATVFKKHTQCEGNSHMKSQVCLHWLPFHYGCVLVFPQNPHNPREVGNQNRQNKHLNDQGQYECCLLKLRE